MTTKPILRLYQITDTVTHLVVPDTYFASKKHAVQERIALNEELSPHALRYVVSPGPDNKHHKA